MGSRSLACWNAAIDFVVYERNPCVGSISDQQGGSLDLHASTGQLVMKRAGLTAEFERYARRGGHALMLDKTGKQLLTFGEGRDAPEIDRAQLRRLLAKAIPAEKIRWNKAVTAVDRDEKGAAVISFADGSTADGFKLVVGADGAWSRVRHLVTSLSLLSPRPGRNRYSASYLFLVKQD